MSPRRAPETARPRHNAPLAPSTPLTVRHHRARMPQHLKSVRPLPRLPVSPLPPSSPPETDDEEGVVGVGPVGVAMVLGRVDEREGEDEDGGGGEARDSGVAEDEEDEDKENDGGYAPGVDVEEVAGPGEAEMEMEMEDDDPFGILEVERQLKVQREAHARSSVAPPPSKAPHPRVRAPFGELHYAPYSNDPRISHAHGWATGPTSSLTVSVELSYVTLGRAAHARLLTHRLPHRPSSAVYRS